MENFAAGSALVANLMNSHASATFCSSVFLTSQRFAPPMSTPPMDLSSTLGRYATPTSKSAPLVMVDSWAVDSKVMAVVPAMKAALEPSLSTPKL